MEPTDRYILTLSYEVLKVSAQGGKPVFTVIHDIPQNRYTGLNYQALVAVQGVLTKAQGEIHEMGVTAAKEQS